MKGNREGEEDRAYLFKGLVHPAVKKSGNHEASN
jgi:hypothetical protein